MSTKELPKYVSHKTVSAIKLELVIHRPNPDITGKTTAGSYGGYLHPVDTSFSPIEVDAAYMTKHQPQPGGYYVKYEDGYTSYSPAAAFEAGYTALSDRPTSGAGSIGAAFDTLKTAMKEDPGYAWSWHCNLAMPIMDAIGVSHADANKAAARLMLHLFGLDTSTHEHFPQQEVETKTLGLTFGLALDAMKKGRRVCRAGWNGKGLWLEYRPANGVDLAYIRMSFPVTGLADGPYPNGARVPWAPSQTDMLAEDWIAI